MNAHSLRSLPFLFSASGPNKFAPLAANKNAPAKPWAFIRSAEKEGFVLDLQYVGYQILVGLGWVVA